MTSDIVPKLSQNFTILKVMAILMVVVDHYYEGIYPFLWIPAAFCLQIFGYSSSYFTSLRYKGNFDKTVYLKKKIFRIGINFLVINIFLTCIFLYQGREGIFTWQTVLYLFGLKGFVYWFGLPNISPYPGITWFLTVLLLFYLIYPLLNSIVNRPIHILLLFFLVIILISKINFQNSLWWTIYGFLLGFVFARIDIKIHKQIVFVLGLSIILIAVILNMLIHIRSFNVVLLCSFFTFFILYVEYLHFPFFIKKTCAILSPFIFEIFILHGTLFIYTQNILLGFILSISLIVFVGFSLNSISSLVKNVVLRTDIPGRPHKTA